MSKHNEQQQMSKSITKGNTDRVGHHTTLVINNRERLIGSTGHDRTITVACDLREHDVDLLTSPVGEERLDHLLHAVEVEAFAAGTVERKTTDLRHQFA